jgi:hypothetical protein
MPDIPNILFNVGAHLCICIALYCTQEEEALKKQRSLAARRRRLAAVLEAEEAAYSEELARLPREERNITDIRQLRAEFRSARAFIHNCIAQKNLYIHWRGGGGGKD